MKKIIILLSLFLFCIFLFVFILTWKIVGEGKPSLIKNYMNSVIPRPVVKILKDTIFYIPEAKQTIREQKAKIENLTFLLEVPNKRNFTITKSPAKSILSETNSKYKLTNYHLNFIIPHYSWKNKPAAYLDQSKENILLVSGYGIFFSFNKKEIGAQEIKLTRIDSNIKNIIEDENFYNPGFISVRDLLIHNDSVFISYVKEQSDKCYNLSILKSNLNLKNLYFNEIFSLEECSPILFTAQSGARLTPYKNNKILLSIGDFANANDEGNSMRALVQNLDSLFGKIISIDLKTKNYEIISIGHRNPQGLYYDRENDIILNTEHGPKGGDEVNVNFNKNKIQNYGWPISSYGDHYDGKFRQDSPLYKSHEEHGFIEPIRYFTPAIGISEIIKIPKTYNRKFTNDYFIGAMGGIIEEGDMSIHHIRLNNKNNKIIFSDIIPLEERVRDLMLIKENKQILLLLENTPNLGLLELDK